MAASLLSLYFISVKYSGYKTKNILEDHTLVVGTITQVRKPYLAVEFKVAGRSYFFKHSVSDELMKGRAAGDTAVVIYSRDDPSNAQLKKGFIPVSEN
ncbi:hypothetical protein AUC43_19020 [Hymenobacter sedentarius]|uniref:DUF3592 domain-containing protein n=2 Tax=Hymenobacter sedentarius TaxID=1411621 RepID=A0A0U4BTM2_9BACT|nr:hypothetical protein AUC43_19020 [Hymenobacter sedentarius]